MVTVTDDTDKQCSSVLAQKEIILLHEVYNCTGNHCYDSIFILELGSEICILEWLYKSSFPSITVKRGTTGKRVLAFKCVFPSPNCKPTPVNLSNRDKDPNAVAAAPRVLSAVETSSFSPHDTHGMQFAIYLPVSCFFPHQTHHHPQPSPYRAPEKLRSSLPLLLTIHMFFFLPHNIHLIEQITPTYNDIFLLNLPAALWFAAYPEWLQWMCDNINGLAIASAECCGESIIMQHQYAS